MTQEDSRSFAPRFAPRDLADALISAAIGIVQIFVLFVLPGMLVQLATGGGSLGLMTGLVLYCVFALCSVSKVEVGSAGIRFKRLLGSPRFLPWSAITGVAEAPRRELIVHGWLWPLLPPREMSPSCTSLGHYRIQYGERFVYFPPSDAAAFLAAVERFSTLSVPVEASMGKAAGPVAEAVAEAETEEAAK